MQENSLIAVENFRPDTLIWSTRGRVNIQPVRPFAIPLNGIRYTSVAYTDKDLILDPAQIQFKP